MLALALLLQFASPLPLHRCLVSNGIGAVCFLRFKSLDTSILSPPKKIFVVFFQEILCKYLNNQTELLENILFSKAFLPSELVKA